MTLKNRLSLTERTMEKTDIAERICKKTRLGWDEGYDRFTQLTGIGKSNNELFI